MATVCFLLCQEAERPHQEIEIKRETEIEMRGRMQTNDHLQREAVTKKKLF